MLPRATRLFTTIRQTMRRTNSSDAPAPLVPGLHDTLKPGDPFRHVAFPRLRPTPRGFDDIPRVAGHARGLRERVRGVDA